MNDEDVYVWWRGGIWKVIETPETAPEFLVKKIRIRWVRGSRPDQGVFHDVKVRDVQTLTAMEVLGLMADDEIVP